MPRVVPNQKEKFESDEFLKRHSREGEVSLKVRFTICNDNYGMKINARLYEKGLGGDDTFDDSNCDLGGNDCAALECEGGGDDARAGLRIKYFGFRSDSNLVIRPCCSCPSRPDSLRRVFSSVLIKAPFLLYPPAFCTSIFFLPDLAEI